VLKKLKYIPKIMLPIVAMMFIAISAYTLNDRKIDYDVDLAGTIVPSFDAVELPFAQYHKDATSLPFTASAAIDIDGDGVEELFIGGGYRQGSVMYRYKDGGFVEIPDAAGINSPVEGTTLSALVLDVNADGKSDMLVSRPEGIWLYTNTGGAFTGQKLVAPLDGNTTPLSIAVADVNNDGAFDMYISGYIRNDLVEGLNIFNKESYGGTSALLINNGDNSFSNETEARGLLYLHNTFQATFGDFEGDGDLDLIVAHDTGHVRTWVNDGTGNFTNAENPNSQLPSYPMGIAIADVNNDGLTDYAFSNIGSTPPSFLVRGDLRDEEPLHRKWIGFQADGNGGFTDEAENMRIADYEFAWGMSYEDLNLDGREDLIVSENFVTAPFHKIPFLRLPGRMLVQTPSGEFAEVGAKAGVVNRRYSIAPITADFNGDGHPDVVHINIAGKSVAFLSKGDTPNGYLKVRLDDTISSIGAMVIITLEDSSTIYKPYVSGEGLASDSSHVIIAGLGAQKATSVRVKYLGGPQAIQIGSFQNETINFGGTN
jgi:hypothetical protein